MLRLSGGAMREIALAYADNVGLSTPGTHAPPAAPEPPRSSSTKPWPAARH